MGMNVERSTADMKYSGQSLCHVQSRQSLTTVRLLCQVKFLPRHAGLLRDRASGHGNVVKNKMFCGENNF